METGMRLAGKRKGGGWSEASWYRGEDGDWHEAMV